MLLLIINIKIKKKDFCCQLSLVVVGIFFPLLSQKKLNNMATLSTLLTLSISHSGVVRI